MICKDFGKLVIKSQQVCIVYLQLVIFFHGAAIVRILWQVIT